MHASLVLRLPKFSLLCPHMINIQLCLCPHAMKQEHHRNMYSSIRNSIRNYDFNSDPNGFFLMSLSSLSFAQPSFAQRECMRAKNGKFVTNCWLLMERKKRQLLSKKPLHINSSILCTGNLGLISKNQTVSSEPEHSSTCCHWYEVFWAIPPILTNLYNFNKLAAYTQDNIGQWN